MKNSRNFHSIPRRITAVTAVRSKIDRRILGWLFKCYTCFTEEVFMISQHDKALARTHDHICKGRGNAAKAT